ncbi:hypothetical protein [Paraburkholderia sp. JHI869]|uniref:hypothetical protein n=1 Tax=Paraburkholderia sp. JHI869 TaxID=3112959 RepID=UPI0031807223
MSFNVKLSWRAFGRLPDSAPNYVAGEATSLFEVRTGKSVLREIGGDIESAFFPLVLEPQGPFFTRIAPVSRGYGFTNSKTVFHGTIPNRVSGASTSVSSKFGVHVYGRHVCVTIDCSTFEAADDSDFAIVQDISNYPGIVGLAKKIIEIVASGSGAAIPVHGDLKVFPCIQITALSEQAQLSSSDLVEVITRHPRANDDLVEEMFEKNRKHQIDGTTTLLDRQGIVCYLPSSAHPDEKASSDRRFRSCAAMIELAAAAQRRLRDTSTLDDDVIDALSRLIEDPEGAIPNSTSAQRAWVLLSKEFSLAETLEKAKGKVRVLRDVSTRGTGHSQHKVTESGASAEVRDGKIGTRSVLCVAAAAVELAAVYAQLKESFGTPKTVQLDDSQEYLLQFLDSRNAVVWNLISLSFQGQTEAAVEVKALCLALRPTIVLMIGMCMAMPGKALPVGTVVVPNEVTVFDHTRLIVEGVQQRPHGDRVDNEMFKLARIVSVKQQFPFKVVTDKGLASASSKVENVNSELISFISESFQDAVAFDMEGWGFYRAGAGQRCLWIKAVADAGETQQADFSHQLGKKATQANVTKNAAKFAIDLVQEFVDAHGLSAADN